MKTLNRIPALTASLLVAGCVWQGSSSLDLLNRAEAVGSPFTKTLASEYRALATRVQNEKSLYSLADSQHFARKGLAAASGLVVMPETLSDWSLGDSNIAEMSGARADLVGALEKGGREMAPGRAAVTQVTFDCWVEQQKQNWITGAPCKPQFYDSLKALQDIVGSATSMAPAPAATVEELPAPDTAKIPATAMPARQAMFMVFFDSGKKRLSANTNDVLDAVAQEVKSRPDLKAVIVSGHTDSSGSPAHNRQLSLQRAQAVKDGLVTRGVNQVLIRVEAEGESTPLVQTSDNAREPANRSVQITLE
jgi:OOP family OmpA-OmpF porin